MPRIARVVAENYPHHIVQRGNRCQQVFFNEKDYNEYLNLLEANSKEYNVDIVTYCLMPNHVHLIVVPHKGGDLACAIAETHRNYTRYINFREKWKGYLWQGRFSSYVLDEKYLLAAVRYILLNPVKGKLTINAWDYKWSSAKQHLDKKRKGFIRDKLLQSLIDDWRKFLDTESDSRDIAFLQMHERTGRPLGDVNFIDRLGQLLNRDLKRKQPGPKKKRGNEN